MYLVRSGALQGFEMLVAQLGENPSLLLAELGFSSAQLRQPDAYLAYPRVAELMERAAEVCHCPWFGFELSRRQRNTLVSELALRSAQEPTCAQAFDVTLQYGYLLASGLTTALHSQIHTEECQISMKFEFTSPRGTTQLMQLSLGVLYRSCLDTLPGESQDFSIMVTQDVPALAEFGSQPKGYPTLYFSQDKNAVSFPKRWLGEAPRRDEQYLSEHLQQQLDYMEATYPDNLVLQLRYSISSLLPSGECSLDRCAAALGLHPRLLQKRLQEQNLKYADVLRETREQIALQHLQNSSISLTDLALNLGFAELAVFSRSFKRWQGVSPQQWQKQHRSNNNELI